MVHILTYDIKKLDLFILVGDKLATDNRSYSIACIRLKIKIEYLEYVHLGWKTLGKDTLYLSSDTISWVLKCIIVSFRSDHRSSKSIVLPATLGNKLETELCA